MRLLALSGSLRAASLNTALLRAACKAAPSGIEVVLYEALGTLPLYNPDLDEGTLPPTVLELRALVGGSAALLIACPEYAHGIPGAFKNALDWLVGSTEFPGKPVALLNASPRSTHVQTALREVLATMSARLVPEVSITVPLLGSKLDVSEIEVDPEIADMLRTALTALARAV